MGMGTSMGRPCSQKIYIILIIGLMEKFGGGTSITPKLFSSVLSSYTECGKPQKLKGFQLIFFLNVT